jgi:hypothetical protein
VTAAEAWLTYDEETSGFSWIGHGVRAFWSDDNSNTLAGIVPSLFFSAADDV